MRFASAGMKQAFPGSSPVELDITTFLDFAGRWIAADWCPDLSLKLALCNVVAKERVVCMC